MHHLHMWADDSTGRPALLRDQQLISLSQLLRLQSIQTIFQLESVEPSSFRLTHALALAVTAFATPE
jgi:hypothetical protein